MTSMADHGTSTTTRPWCVLSLTPVPRASVEDWLRPIDGIALMHAEPRTQATVQALAPDAEIVLTDWSGTLRWSAAEVALAPRLAYVHSPSVGVEGIDLDACARAGVPVTNPAGLNAQSVAEWCLAAAFAVARDLAGMDAGVRSGGWPGQEAGRRTVGELAGQRVGVLGFGAIGSRVARLFGALGCDVAYWTRTARPPEEAGAASWLPLEALLAHAQVLVVNLPRTPDTIGLLDRARLERLPPRAIVVDASRGGIVDHDALCDLLDEGHLAGAAVDVYPQEPPATMARIRRTERTLLSPHAASYTPQALASMLGRVTENVRRAVAGEPVFGVINGVDPVIRRR